MRRLPMLLALGLLATSPAVADPLDITTIPLAPADGSPPLSSIGRLDYLAGFELTSDNRGWGGISGASIEPDGSTLTVIADTGAWHRLTLRHDDHGHLTGIDGGESGRLMDTKGQPLDGKGRSDAEGLARGSDGSYYVTFEGWPRLWQYRPASDPLRAAARRMRAPEGMSSLPTNRGVEAVAALPDGRFLLLSEGNRLESGDIRGWVGDGRRWSEIGLAATGAFVPTDLALLPTGDLLLLERSVSLFGGFAARLSMIPAAAIAPGARLVASELSVIAKPLPVDNFEAVAARAGPNSAILIYLLSDDNFGAMGRTLLLQLRWRP